MHTIEAIEGLANGGLERFPAQKGLDVYPKGRSAMRLSVRRYSRKMVGALIRPRAAKATNAAPDDVQPGEGCRVRAEGLNSCIFPVK